MLYSCYVTQLDVPSHQTTPTRHTRVLDISFRCLDKEDKRPQIIHLRFQNGRQTYYPRLVLDEKFKDYFGEKALKVMVNNFVPSNDERLLYNARNDFFGDMIKMHEGSLPVSRRP